MKRIPAGSCYEIQVMSDEGNAAEIRAVGLLEEKETRCDFS
jgi:hypothetical protein